MQRITHANEKAFTLVEVLISTLILGFALGSLLLLFTKCSLATETFKSTAIAAGHVRQVLEQMRVYNSPAAVVAAGDWSAWAGSNVYTLGNEDCVVSEGEDCKVLKNEQVEVTYPAGEDAIPLEVLVNITWEDRGSGRQREIQAVTLLTGR